MIRSSDHPIIDHHCAQAPRLIPASDALFYVFLIATTSICILYLKLCILVFYTMYNVHYHKSTILGVLLYVFLIATTSICELTDVTLWLGSAQKVLTIKSTSPRWTLDSENIKYPQNITKLNPQYHWAANFESFNLEGPTNSRDLFGRGIKKTRSLVIL